jgi:hypothetical protein
MKKKKKDFSQKEKETCVNVKSSEEPHVPEDFSCH